MMVTKENRSTVRKTCSDVVLSTINLTRAVLGSNPGLSGDRQATDWMMAQPKDENLAK